MNKQQLYTRLGPDVVERVIRRFNEHGLTVDEATAALGVSRAQVYNLRTQWLAAGKSASVLGASGGDHAKAWPKAAFGRMCRAFGVSHLVAPTPQAKGKVERAMQTFQHRLVVVLIAEGVDNEARANVVARVRSVELVGALSRNREKKSSGSRLDGQWKVPEVSADPRRH